MGKIIYNIPAMQNLYYEHVIVQLVVALFCLHCYILKTIPYECT